MSRTQVLSPAQLSVPPELIREESVKQRGFPWARLLLYGSTVGVVAVSVVLVFDPGEPDSAVLLYARVAAAIALLVGVLLVHLRCRRQQGARLREAP